MKESAYLVPEVLEWLSDEPAAFQAGDDVEVMSGGSNEFPNGVFTKVICVFPHAVTIGPSPANTQTFHPSRLRLVGRPPAAQVESMYQAETTVEQDDVAREVYAATHPEHVSETGGRRKNAGKLRADLVPASWDEALAAVLTKGAAKYADRNWEKGMEFGVCLGSLKRHLIKFMKGEDIDVGTPEDPGTMEPHTALIAVNALFILEYQRRIAAGTLPASLDNRAKH